MQELPSKSYNIDSKTLADTLNYLATRPYREVAAFINLLAKDIEVGNAKDSASSVHEEQRTRHSES
jgi:hypothetical protein